MITKQQSRRLVRLIEEYKEACVKEVYQPFAYKESPKAVAAAKARSKGCLLTFLDQITDEGVDDLGGSNEH